MRPRSSALPGAPRMPGWYEEPGDPWNVRWWNGAEWTGQLVPVTVQMLTTPPSRKRPSTKP
ncbi:DUF2510 domain-containing protein [Lacisediminihabitans sp.]|uniref:DUF2510 domain-containing protein n=1 Tax=Lacisediminihabitans sp. TaxID=2787631 RepID=UPI002EDB71BB